MKTSRILMVAGGCTAILGAGMIAAPEPAPAQVDASGTPVPAGGQVFEGSVEANLKGQYQVEIVVVDGAVVQVNKLRAGSTAPESIAVNTMALPILEERMIEAQTWDVEYVTGASYTSPAITESARAAFEAAGITTPID